MEVPKDVKVNTRAVLLSSKNGVGLKRFNRDYKTLLGELSLACMPEAFRLRLGLELSQG